MTARLAIPLKAISSFAQEHDDPNTCVITQDLLFEFEKMLGAYQYDQEQDEIFWDMDKDRLEEFKKRMGL